MSTKKLFIKVINNTNNKYNLSEKLAFEIIAFIKKNPYYKSGYIYTKCSEIAKRFDLKPIEVREYIQFIRENNHIFHNPTSTGYILANKYGYFYSNNIVEKQIYLKQLRKTIKSKIKQRDELLVAIRNENHG